MENQILIGLILALLVAVFWNRPWRGFVGLTFNALVCFLSVLFMRPAHRTAT